MKTFRFYCRHWSAVGGVIFAALAFATGIWGGQIPMTQRFMVLMYMALLLHEFEEYVFPGGFPAAINIGFFGEKQDYDKYPLNELSALLVNVVCAYPIYIVGIFCHKWLWYDIFIAYFTMVQVFVHCLKLNVSLKSWYSPGCFSALFVMLPLGIYFLVQLAGNYDVPAYCWWAPAVAFPAVAVLTILLPILICRKKETSFAFAPFEKNDFAVKNGIAALFRK